MVPDVPKLVPVRVITVPPDVTAEVGERDEMVGGANDMKLELTDWPATLIVSTWLAPCPAGTVQTRLVCERVALFTGQLTPGAPTVTKPETPKLVPVTVSCVPPTVG